CSGDLLKLRRRAAGAECEHPDARLAVLCPERFGEGQYERLAGGIGSDLRDRLVRGDRSDVDDRAVTARTHRTQRGVRQHHERGAVHPHHLHLPLDGDLVEAPARTEAGVVHEEVDLPLRRRDTPEPQRLSFDSQIRGHHHNLHARAMPQLPGENLQPLRAPGGDHQRHPMLSELASELLPESRRRTGHQRPPAPIAPRLHALSSPSDGSAARPPVSAAGGSSGISGGSGISRNTLVIVPACTPRTCSTTPPSDTEVPTTGRAGATLCSMSSAMVSEGALSIGTP